MIESIEVEAEFVQPGDRIPGLGGVIFVKVVGNGRFRRVQMVVDDAFLLIAKKVDQKVPVERDT